ncbi:DNA recombination protein RmuC [bacterium]|nr:DNA recombination protein RmuC [bacterium]
MFVPVVLSIVAVLVVILIVISLILLNKSKNSEVNGVTEKLDGFEKRLADFDSLLKDEFERSRRENLTSDAATREEAGKNLLAFQNSVNGKLDALTKSTQDSVVGSITKLMGEVRENLKNIQDGNEKKLEEMRKTVDEKLHDTLEKRLTGSFEIVTKQLEAVQKGLGEMQNLASDVGGLKRALTNVKTAGGMGEVQLEAILDQMLSPEQYVKNSHPNPSDLKKVVEFAVKIPSKTADGEFVLLPIDSKYPAEVWNKLTLAYENADKKEIDVQRRALTADIKKMAKDIREKYIEPPFTTDFGLMFLPFEGLFAEVICIPALFQDIQHEFRVTIVGPTTLGAFLNSLQMGFRTLAIQKETSKVWELLGAVKTEFGKFGDVLAATKKKLESASSEIEKAETRTRVIERKLKNVAELPAGESGTSKILDEN